MALRFYEGMLALGLTHCSDGKTQILCMLLFDELEQGTWHVGKPNIGKTCHTFCREVVDEFNVPG